MRRTSLRSLAHRRGGLPRSARVLHLVERRRARSSCGGRRVQGTPELPRGLPNATEGKHVRELLETIIGRLIDHELYVARFYLNRDNYDAAAARVRYALRTYIASSPDSRPRDAEVAPEFGAKALLLLGETYLKMKKWSDARDAFESVVHTYATSPIAVQAKGYLDHMRAQGV